MPYSGHGMALRKRLYDAVLTDHLHRHRQMALVTGPRQVGKTTTCRSLSAAYLDWDNVDDRRVIARDRKPWMLVEAKKSEERLSPSLAHFQRQTGAPHAFQVVLDAAYVAADCFTKTGTPLVVPAWTFLSQLL